MLDIIIVALLIVGAVKLVKWIRFELYMMDYNQRKKREEKELREKMSKLPKEQRKCSNCRYGQQIKGTNSYNCSYFNWEGTEEEAHMGCIAFHHVFASFLK